MKITLMDNSIYNCGHNMNDNDYQIEILSESQISAIGRARVSEGSEDEIRNSLKTQVENIKELANKLNVGKIYWFIEKQAVSAYKFGGDTELFKKAREFACLNTNVKYFLQLDQTRFCRDRRSSINFKHELRKNGIEVRFVHGDIENKESTIGILMDALQEAKAQADNVEHAERVLSRCKTNAKDRDKETGWCFKNGGLPLYGYKRHRIEYGKKKNGDPLLKTIWIENDEIVTCVTGGKSLSKTVAGWARYILFDLRLKKGMSFDKIRDHLNEIGLPAPRKKHWNDSTICELTRNVGFTGTGVYNKHNWSSYRRQMGLKIKPDKEIVIIENAHPALITKSEYEMLQNMVKPANKLTRPKRRQQSESSYLLTPYSFCKSCNGRIIGKTKRYRCGTYDRQGAKVCGAPLYTVPNTWIEAEVLKGLGLVDDEGILERSISEILKLYMPNVNKNDCVILRKRIEVDESAKSNLLKTLESTSPPQNALLALMSRLEELEKSISSCKEELARISRPVVIPSRNNLLNRFKSVINIFKESSYEEKRAILQTFIKRIEFDPLNKCITVEAYCDPLSAWKHIDNKDLASNSRESVSSRTSYFEEDCGGWI